MTLKNKKRKILDPMYLMAEEPEKIVFNHLETNLAQLNAGVE